MKYRSKGCHMNYLNDFLRQETPKHGKDMPGYYHRALFLSEVILAVYFLASAVVLFPTAGNVFWVPVAFLVITVVIIAFLNGMSATENLICFSAMVVLWQAWFIHMFGWVTGGAIILVPILSLAYFNIYVSPMGKIACSLGLVVFRIASFAYSLRHVPVSALDSTTSLCFQAFHSVVSLAILSLNFILFSSSIQSSERLLILNNQELYKEAGTDPLTGLPNRRAILDVIEEYRNANPDASFAIAIADIDYFKKVNDTYGHNCGDYTLKELSRLFLTVGAGKYTVCRWGGEEFCFFMPGMNIDQAGRVMQDLNGAVKDMPLRFGDTDFSITITIGVEEYDFKSPTEAIVDRADRKLYMGKVHGRNQVVV